MMIRQDFNDLPPKAFLIQIVDAVTKIYMFLWDKKDKENKVYFTWKDLSKYYQRNNFRTSLRALCNEGLLNWDETMDGISVELVGWDDIVE